VPEGMTRKSLQRTDDASARLREHPVMAMDRI
jgi:hypothetical protein